MSPILAHGLGVPSLGFALASSRSGETAAVLVQHDAALVRSVDLRPGTPADGDAWIVLLFGSVFVLVAAGFFVAWLMGRMRKATMVPLRVDHRPALTPANAEGL